MTTTTTTNAAPAHRERVQTFRITFDQLDTLKRAARARRTTVSTVIREALSKVDGE